MTRYANRWTALLAWAALMGIVWALFVPGGVSGMTFTLLALTGPIVLLVGSAMWAARQPTPSLGQAGVLAGLTGAPAPVRK